MLRRAVPLESAEERTAARGLQPRYVERRLPPRGAQTKPPGVVCLSGMDRNLCIFSTG
jgi:hypothetical protein